MAGIGKKFEKIFFEHFFPTENFGTSFGFKDTRDSELDSKQGTDFLYRKIPFDITTDFSGKKDTMSIGYQKMFSLSGTLVYIGIREGNGRIKFDTPVVVIGVIFSLDVSYFEMETVAIKFDKNWNKIFDLCSDLWNNYMFNKEERI